MSRAEIAPALATGRWTVLPGSARASFRCRDVLHRTVTGTVSVTAGAVDVDARGVPVSVLAELDLSSVDTGNARRDRDLRGPRMLDAEGSPLLAFRGGPATARDDGGWVLPATLTMKGVTCPVEVAVAVNGHRVSVSATVDRRELGIRAPRLLVGTAVTVLVEAELVPPA